MKINSTYLVKQRKTILFYSISVLFALFISFLIYKKSYANNECDFYNVELNYDYLGLCTKMFPLPKGNCSVTVDYSTAGNVQFKVMMDDAVLAVNPAPAVHDGSIGSVTFNCFVPWSSTSCLLCVDFADIDGIRLNHIHVTSERPMNNDALFCALAFFIVALAILALIFLASRKILGTRRLSIICIMFAGIMVASLPVFGDVMYEGHDLLGLCGRIEGIKEAWDNGQLYPVVMPNAFNGYGYLEYMYPELFLLIPAFLRRLNMSMVLALHFYEILINAATALLTYFAVKTILDDLDDKVNKDVHSYYSLLASICYLFCYYRLSDLYIRAAIGEAVSMAFLPFAIAGVYHILAGDRKKWWMAVIGMSGIYHSHILSCLLIVPVILAFGIFYFRNIFKDKRYKETVFSVGAFFIINLWNIIPFVKFYKFGLNLDALTVEKIDEHAVKLSQLFSLTSGGLDSTYFLRSMGVCGMIILVYVIYEYVIFARKYLSICMKEREKQFVLMSIFLVCFVLFTFMSLDIMPWNWIVSGENKLHALFSLLQFPFRLLTVSSCCLTMLLPIAMLQLEFNNARTKIIVALILSFALIDARVLMDNYIGIGEAFGVNAGGFETHVPYEYLPSETNLDVIYDKNAYIDNGEIEFVKAGDQTIVNYTAFSDTTANVPIFYFPCYRAFDESGNEIELYRMENNRIGLKLPAGSHTVSLKIKLFF